MLIFKNCAAGVVVDLLLYLSYVDRKCIYQRH